MTTPDEPQRLINSFNSNTYTDINNYTTGIEMELYILSLKYVPQQKNSG